MRLGPIMKQSEKNPQGRLSAVQLLAYGSPMLPLAMGFSILIMLIPSFYGLELGLGLGLVGFVLAVGRIFDFITDPIIGDLSDHTRSPIGPRKPWVFVGLFLFCLSCFGLFSPPSAPSGFYLLAMACLYFLSFTLTDVPLSAMGLEISENTHERTRLAGSKSFIFIIGGILGALIPTLSPDNIPLALRHTTLVITLTSLLVVPFFFFFTPNSAKNKNQDTERLFSAYRAFFTDRNLQRIIGVFFLLIIGASLSGSLALLYVTYVLKAPEIIGPVWMLNGLGLLCGVPIWYVISKRIGKVKTWRLAIIFGLGAGLPLLILGPGDVGLMLILAFVIGLCGAAEAMMPMSLLADHVAKIQGQGALGQAGRISGFKNAISKLSIILPLAIAFPILEAVGISNVTDPIVQTSLDISVFQHLVLIVFYVGVPLFLRASAWLFIPRLWPEQWRDKARRHQLSES